MAQLKNLVLKSLIFALPLLISTALSGSATNTLKIETEPSEKSIYLSFKDNQSSNVFIQIKDKIGAVLYKEKVVNQKEFSKKFNLTNLPEGEYFIEVADDLKAIIQPIVILTSNIKITPSKRSEFYKPVFKYKNNKLDINLLANNCQSVAIDVIESHNQIIFSQKFKNEGKPFGERFDLGKLEKGVYNVRIIAGNQSYYKTVEVK